LKSFSFSVSFFRACTVVVHDLNDTAHQLDVTAEMLSKRSPTPRAMVRGLKPGSATSGQG